MRKLLLSLLLLIPSLIQAQTYTLNYDSVRVGKTPNSSVLIPKDLYLKGFPKGNLSIRADGKVVHNDTLYAPITGGGYLANSNALGTLYSNSNFTSLTGLTQNGGGTIATVSGGALYLANPVGTDLTHTLDVSGSAYCLPNWNFEVTAVVPSSPVVNTQLIVGTRSIPGEIHQLAAGLDLTATGTSGRLRIVSGTTGTTLVTSAVSLPIAVGDTVKLTFTRIDYLTYRARALNLTTNASVDVSAFYDSEADGRISVATNTGYLSLFAGTVTPIKVISYVVESNTPKNAQLIIASDSKWGGYLSTAYVNTIYGRLSTQFNIVHTSGGGDRTSSLIAQLNELIALKPKVVILDYSSNDYRNGISQATTIANLTTSYNTLTAAGIQVWICDGEYEVVNDLGPLAAAIRATFPTAYIPTFAWTKAIGAIGLTPDGYHLSDIGNEILSTNVAKYIFNTSLKTPIIRPAPVFVKSGTYSIQRAQPATLSGAAGDRTNMLFKLFYNGTDPQSIGMSVAPNTSELYSIRDFTFYGSIATPLVTINNAGLSVAGTGSPTITATSNSTGTTSNASFNAVTPDGTNFQFINWGINQSGNTFGLARSGKAMIVNNNAAALAIGNIGAQSIYLATNGAVRAEITGAGAFIASGTITGSISALATAATTFVTHTGGLLQSRTPTQVRSDIGAGTGNGTVTNVSVTTANGVSGSVANATTTPAITLTLDTATTYRTVLNSNSKAQDDARFLKLTTAATTYVPVTGSTLNVDMNAKNITNAGQLQATSVVQADVGATSLTVLGNGGIIRPSLGQTANYGGIQMTNSSGLNNIWSAKLSGTDQLLYSSTSGHKFYTQGTNLTMSIDNIGLTLNKITAGSSGADSIMVHASDGKVKVISPTFYATPTAVVEITGTSQSGAINTIYIPHNAGLTTITLPITTTIGSLVQIIGEGAGGWKIAQNSGQFIKGVGITTTTGTGGSIASTDPSCTITLRLVSTGKWAITSSQGTLSPI